MAEKNKNPALWLIQRVAGLIYPAEAHGAETLGGCKGGMLLVPNEMTPLKALILQEVLRRRIRFVTETSVWRESAWSRWLLGLLGAVPAEPRELAGKVSDLLRAGEIVCPLCKPVRVRPGTLLRWNGDFQEMALAAGAPVAPVWLDEMWGALFAFHWGKRRKGWCRQLPYPISIEFGEPIEAARADAGTVREQLWILGERAYQRRPILRGHLARACLRGLKHQQFERAVIDGMDGSVMSRGMVLAVSIALSEYLRAHCPSRRVAVVLPPGRAAVIANAALMFAGKVPVNLNFTAGTPAVAAAIRIAGIAEVITAGPVIQRLEGFPWPEKTVRIEEAMPGLKPRIGLWRLLVLLPWRLVAAWLRLPKTGDREEAVILFTSGSAGDPKGVVLSHRNILGNVSQFSSMLDLTREDAVLGCLPFFHSFGCTVTLWYPLIEGIRLVTYPSALETAKNVELIQKHRVTLLISTPTFLRSYLRKAEPEQIASLKLVATGAEKLPGELARAFEARFGKVVEQGYGLTETSPVVSVNLPDPDAPAGELAQAAGRFGSVGKMAPGMAAQIRDPDTGEVLPPHETGMLWLRGPNIFEGYLKEPERTAAVMDHGWFKTGDLGRFDEDGFLFIEGRLSRFSKIGGEMVPHETVEARVREVLSISQDDHSIAVAGIPDEAKGEALVLLATIEIDAPALRAALAETGIPNLWIPRRVSRVEAIPTLASGKLDMKRLRELALAG